MIAAFLGFSVDPERPDKTRLAFTDSDERSWFVELPGAGPFSLQIIENALNTAVAIAENPEQCVKYGFLSQIALDLANSARDKMRLTRSLTDGRKH